MLFFCRPYCSCVVQHYCKRSRQSFLLTWMLCEGFQVFGCFPSFTVPLLPLVSSVHRFSVGVLPGTKLECGPATLHLCNNLLALARDVPPVIIGHWNLPDLRRYGPVPNGFVFEGGTRCGYCKFNCRSGYINTYRESFIFWLISMCLTEVNYPLE